MHELEVSVRLTFTEEGQITPANTKDILRNLMNAIIDQVNGPGLAPENTDYMTDLIEVKSPDGQRLRFDLAQNKFI